MLEAVRIILGQQEKKYAENLLFVWVLGDMKAMRHEVFLQAKSYKGLANAHKLKPLEIELKRLEDLSENIVQDFAHMRH